MSKKLHVLFLCGWYPSKVLPTNGDFIQRHAEAVGLMHNVSVLHIISNKKIKKTTYLETETINGITTHIGYVKKTNNPFLKLIRFLKVYKSILKKTRKIDIVHLNEIYPFGLFALHLKWYKKKPYIISEHWTSYLFPQKNNFSFFEKKISKLICKNASFICPVSSELKDSMLKNGLKGNYKIVGNVIDTSLFKHKQKEDINFTLLHVSSMLDEHKNISGMLRVAKKLESKIGKFTWKFIGGKTGKLNTLKNKLEFKKATVEFINHISQEKLVGYLQKTDLYISFSNYETFGIVMVEALSCGVPVISTNTGILKEVTLDNSFKIIPIKDEESLLTEIVSFKENKLKMNPKKMHNFVVEKYSKEKIANQFSTLYLTSLKV